MKQKVGVKYCYQHPQRGWYCSLVPLGKTYKTESALIKALKGTKPGREHVAKYTKKQEKAQHCGTEALIHRTRCLAKYTLTGKRQWFPADVHSRKLQLKKQLSRQMFKSDPALHFLSILLRMAPWKDALAHAWESRARRAETRTSLIRGCLQDSAEAINRLPVAAQWQDSAVRNQLMCAGPEACARSLVLEGKRSPFGWAALMFGSAVFIFDVPFFLSPATF